MRELDANPIYYVYIHLRASDGTPFYVGKGKGKRAWDKRSRSDRWKRVVEKYGYIVNLAWGGLSEKEAFEWEVHLIEQFRLSGYPLVNHCDGGEGVSNKKQIESNQNKIRDFHKKNNRFPSQCKPEEKPLYITLMSYCSYSNDAFDSDFRAEMELLGYGENNVAENKQKIRDFREKNGRFPSDCKPEERQLYSLLSHYCSPSGGSFDTIFREEMVSLGYGNHIEENKQELRDFRNTNGRFPSRYKPTEKQLYTALVSYCSPCHICFDPVFRIEMVSLGYAEIHAEEHKQEIRDFIKENERFPSRTKPEEKRLHGRLASYCSPAHDCFDPDFRKEMESLGYGKGNKKEKLL